MSTDELNPPKVGHDYEVINSEEAWGDSFNFGIKILASCPHPQSERLQLAGYKAREIIEEAIKEDFYENDLKSQEFARAERAQLLNLFRERIYDEAIPNGYCPRACCRHRPWFVVTTSQGRIQIGWRKRVISIDWSDSRINEKADELFPAESVTKYERMIHAWGYEDAQKYLDVILKGQPL